MTQPIQKISMPNKIAYFLPLVSERGPNTSSPNTMPNTNALITNCVSLLSSSAKLAAIAGKAGNIVSIDKATNEVNKAKREINSTGFNGAFSIEWDLAIFIIRDCTVEIIG